MELEESTFLTSDYSTKLQLSREYDTGTNTEIQINGTIQKAQREIYVPMDTLDCKEIQPVHSEGGQPWDFFGRNDAKAETPELWPPHVKS